MPYIKGPKLTTFTEVVENPAPPEEGIQGMFIKSSDLYRGDQYLGVFDDAKDPIYCRNGKATRRKPLPKDQPTDRWAKPVEFIEVEKVARVDLYDTEDYPYWWHDGLFTVVTVSLSGNPIDVCIYNPDVCLYWFDDRTDEDIRHMLSELEAREGNFMECQKIAHRIECYRCGYPASEARYMDTVPGIPCQGEESIYRKHIDSCDDVGVPGGNHVSRYSAYLTNVVSTEVKS